MIEIKDLVVTHLQRGLRWSWREQRARVDRRTIDSVSLDLAAGENLGLIGESGSGKTTLGRSIIGLQKVSSGSIIFEGRELVGLRDSAYRKVRRRMSMIFQDPVGSLSPRKTIAELLHEPCIIHGVELANSEHWVAELLQRVGLDPAVAASYPHQLSGGQARRVGVARAIALEPGLVIADEPTAGLDLSVQSEVVNLLIDLQRMTGVGYLFITHNLALASRICDRLAILFRGVVVETGPASSVFSMPAHPYTRQLVTKRGTQTRSPSVVQSMPAAALDDTNRRGCVFAARCTLAQSRCHESRPPPRSLAEGRVVSCHYPLVSGEAAT